MIGEKCDCFYGGPGEVSIIKNCSHRHLTSKAHIEKKHLTLGGTWGRTENSRNIFFTRE